jgi:NAD(P)H-hydrate epimerase
MIVSSLRQPLTLFTILIVKHITYASAHTCGLENLVIPTTNHEYSKTTTYAMLSQPSDSREVSTGYLTAAAAYALDQDLLQTPGYTLEQLMELAGLSVAEAVVQVVPKSKILLICGPGNNGGDGLVAARHLMFFGYQTVVVYPKRSHRENHYINLVKQCEDMGIVILDELPKDLPTFGAMVDAIFGFSFQGVPRMPFQDILHTMMQTQRQHNIPIISVDVPSGWNVDEGDVSSTGFMPQVLISLTTPKHSSKLFSGRHFCGGRFLPPRLAAKYNIQMPPYPGVSQVVELPLSYRWEHEYAQHCAEQEGTMMTSILKEPKEDSWEAGYAEYCVEKERTLNIPDKKAEVMQKISVDQSSWEEQYAAHCVQKELDVKP